MESLVNLARIPRRPSASVLGSVKAWNETLIHGIAVHTAPIQWRFKGIVNGSLLFSRNSPDPHSASILHHCGTMVTWTISSTKCCWDVGAGFFFVGVLCSGSANVLHYCIAVLVAAAEWISVAVAHRCMSLVLSGSRRRTHTQTHARSPRYRVHWKARLYSMSQ